MCKKPGNFLLLSVWLLSACSATVSENPELRLTVPPVAANNRINDPTDHNFQQWARNDAIPPIYDPEFAAANQADLQDDELVMGVTLGGEAKAYPVTVMQFREMVNDELAGIPILVTW